MTKKKIGIFSLTSCDGCQIILLDMDKDFFDIAKKFEIIDFALIKDINYDKTIDIAIIEGTPVKTKEIKKLKKIRSISNKVIALGTCATFGGVSGMRDYNEENVKNASYDDTSFLDLVEDVKGIGNYIKVDYYIRGCPPVKEEILKVLNESANNKKIEDYNYSVCVECKKNENPCFLKDNIKCMGPITYGGCDSICINNKVSCYGCRGPLKSANMDSLYLILKNKIGMDTKEIKNMFMLYAGSVKRYKKVIDND